MKKFLKYQVNKTEGEKPKIELNLFGNKTEAERFKKRKKK